MTSHAKSSGRENMHLSQQELVLLLSEDDKSNHFRAAAEHLEFCETCQSQLTTFVGDPGSWEDVQSLRDTEGQLRWEPDLSQSLVSTGDTQLDRQSIYAHVRQLLGTPNHPEMLGRLGRYDIEQIIGSGGMGIVLKAHDSELNRPIAIKLLAPHLSHVGAARERFAREGRAAAAVVHEHVVAIHNVEADGTLPFLIMQYVPGRSLQARVDEDGPLGIEEILRIGMQSAAGLAAAHAQGLVHRDVKPSNILLEDTVERAVLTDFGLARAIDDASLTQTGILAGTPHYMSPEQASGSEIDARSDLFSLGAVLYFMATGHPPFRAAGAMAVLHRICREPHRPVWQSNKNVPDELSDVIDRLLEKKPSRRLASANEVRQELAGLLSRAQQYGLGRRRFASWRGRRGRRKLWMAAGILAAALAVAGVTQWFAANWNPAQTIVTSFATEQQPAQEAHPLIDAINADVTHQNEHQFFTNLEAARNSLNEAGRPSVYLGGRDDEWRQGIESLQHDLKNAEFNNR